MKIQKSMAQRLIVNAAFTMSNEDLSRFLDEFITDYSVHLQVVDDNEEHDDLPTYIRECVNVR